MTITTTKPLPGTVREPLYPDRDGKPMGETGFHVDALLNLRQALQDYFRNRSDVYVGGNIFFYYEKGNPAANKCPDVMVIKGVGNHERCSFKTWEENAVPCVIVENSSQDTIKEDLGLKKMLYASLRIAEYFLFDPEGICLDPPLQGFRLAGSTYVPLTAAEDCGLMSEELGLRLVPEGINLRLIDSQTDQPILTPREQCERADNAEQQVKTLAEEVARLRALLDQQTKKKRR